MRQIGNLLRQETLLGIVVLLGVSLVCAGPVAGAPAHGPSRTPVSSAAAARLTPADSGQTVYDRTLNVTWLANANVAATQTFGVPNINADGSMNYHTALKWVEA